MNNEVYVKELPKSCYQCQFCEKIDIKEKPNGLLLCNIRGKFVCDNKDCPLRSLDEFERQVRNNEMEKFIDAIKGASEFINNSR